MPAQFSIFDRETVQAGLSIPDDNGITDGVIKFTVAAGATTQSGTDSNSSLPGTGGEPYLLVIQTLAAFALGTAVLGLVWRHRAGQ